MNQNDPRNVLRRVMEERGLNPHALAQKAKVRPSTLYNFLSGVSETLSVPVIEKIALAAGVSVDALLGNAPLKGGAIPIVWEVGNLGKLFDAEPVLHLERPPGIDPDEDLVAARSDDALRPMPGSWFILFRKQPEDPERLIGQLCVVRTAQSAAPMIRELRRGSQRGLYTLQFWSAPTIEDVEIVAAHKIVTLSQR